MLILAQADPTAGISNVLAFPVESLLAGTVLFFSVAAVLLGFAYLRLLNSTARANTKRDEIDAELIKVFRTTSEALQTSINAANRAAAASETTAQNVTGMKGTMEQWSSVQRRSILPALKSIYLRVDALDKRFGMIDAIHTELVGLREDCQRAAKTIVEPPILDGDTERVNSIKEK